MHDQSDSGKFRPHPRLPPLPGEGVNTKSAMTTTFIIIRHGETFWNRAHRIQGHLDSDLTTEGIAQAEACALRLKGEAIEAVVSSDLGRARHTTDILTNGLPLPIHFRPCLRERCFGIGEGMTYAEMEAAYPQMFSATGLVDAEFTLPDGESRNVFHQRVRGAIEHLAVTHAGKCVLVVTHGGVLGVIYRWLNALPVGALKIAIPNVGYNRISTVQDSWKIEVWGDTSHLVVGTFEDG